MILKLQDALEAWREVLGSDGVVSDPQALQTAQTATFVTTQRILAIIRPANRQQVQHCLKIASRYQVPIYPISKGRNWGLGSRVPARDGCVLMELDRMSRIVDYDEKLAYITVEPGVTFHQAAEYLRSQKSSLFLAVTGGPPDSSLIGNALERGDGIGPYGDRLAHSCAMEVVLPNGECIHTGFERFEDARVSKISRWGIGPYLDGLFSQSNLGVITKMTFWLKALPEYFQSFLLTLRDRNHLVELVENLRHLQAQSVIGSNSVALWNCHKMIASERQYPWELTADRTPLIPGQLNRLDSPWKDSEWVGVGALYSASKKHGMADRCLVKKLLGGQVESLVFFDAWKSRLARWFERPLRWLTGVDVGEVIQNLYEKPVFLGFPTERSTKSTYWRKRMPVPEDMDPDRDRCGVIWLCPVVPFEGSHIVKAIDRVTTIAYEFGFEPQIAFIFPSERAVYLFPSIIYDREVSGEDERAMACHDRMLKVMVSEGYFPYRLGIQSMASMPAPTDGYDGLVGQIKHLLDPHNVLAPGRYQIIGDTDSSGCQRGTSQDPETQWGEPHSMSCDKLGDNGVAMGSVWSV